MVVRWIFGGNRTHARNAGTGWAGLNHVYFRRQTRANPPIPFDSMDVLQSGRDREGYRYRLAVAAPFVAFDDGMQMELHEVPNVPLSVTSAAAAYVVVYSGFGSNLGG